MDIAERWQRQWLKHLIENEKEELRMFKKQCKTLKRYKRRRVKCSRLMEFKPQGFVFYKTEEVT